jgi:hypothetical protein
MEKLKLNFPNFRAKTSFGDATVTVDYKSINLKWFKLSEENIQDSRKTYLSRLIHHRITKIKDTFN